MHRSLLLLSLFAVIPAGAANMSLFDGKAVAAVIHEDSTTLALAGRLLGRDLRALSGKQPRISARLSDCGATCVVIGRYDSALVKALAAKAGVDLAQLRGEWERYARVQVRAKGRNYLLIAGSDARGAVYGTVDLTRELGVSSWEWWADVTPRKVARLHADGALRFSASPSVQYRGIFLNDEDWGLQPWGAKTYDRAAGDIGPATYARIFELLWRLKANTIWPAMHDVTAPFYSMPGNAAMARDYGIVVGTSHAEPMMRNNVREWDKKQRGDFNFFTNRDNMLAYWKERVEQVKGDEAMFSVGLRGVHDSAMEGAATTQAARDGVAQVIKLQREMLSASLGRPAGKIPQALTLYKEVLDVYKAGLEVPDDVTLIWPDDNYGYLQQLSTPAEARRSGGAGIYYHISYWGRPHDYLWLGTTHPALIREQLQRAWETGARKAWIVNVGDIKPAEYLTQYFLDLAFDQRVSAQTPRAHLRDWAERQFGSAQAGAVAALMTGYYDLAWERRPEFMGFGQTEPTTPNRISAYLQTGGEEAQRRLDRYRELVRQAEAIGAAMPDDRRDAYFELVMYPVRASAAHNTRMLSPALAQRYAPMACLEASTYVQAAHEAHALLVADTAHYNGLAGGKWRHMMDIAPRRLPVFQAPPGQVWSGLYKRCGAEALALKAAGRDRIVSIAATQAGENVSWEVVPGLGSRGASLRSRRVPENQAALEYAFTSALTGPATLKIVALPVHPLTSGDALRVGVSIDGRPLEVMDFATRGRSEEWRLNVLSNTAVKTRVLDQLDAGTHTVRIVAMDPGFILDRIDILYEGAPLYYGAPP